MTPGIHLLSDDEYFADPCPAPSLNNSLIKVLNSRSPAHAWLQHPRLNPAYKPYESDRFDKGTAAHALFLQGEDNCVIVDAEDWRTKAAKEQRDAARRAGNLPLLASQYADVRMMVTVARNYLKSNGYGYVLENWVAERAAVWQHKNGIWCRAKFDLSHPEFEEVWDYKTTSAENPDAFIRSMVPFGYHTQHEFYSGGLEVLMGRRPRFKFFVQEDTEPYACYFVECSPSMEELAAQEIERAVTAWKRCLATDNWPAYPHGVYVADAPVWAMREMESKG